MASAAPRIDQLERNLKINGNFDLWQRGNSIAVSNTAKYTADRWLVSVSSASYTVTATPSTDVPTVAQSGFQSVNSLLLTNGTAPALSSSDRIYLNYRMEGYDYQNIHGKRIREQLWVKTSVAGTYSVTFTNGSNRAYVTTFTAAAATWTAIPLDIAMDTVSGWNFDNSIGLSIFILLCAGSGQQTSSLNAWGPLTVIGASTQTNWAGTTGATFQVAQSMTIPQDFTQGGASNVIVPFQRCGRNFGEELEKAKRYYEFFNLPTGEFFCNGLVQLSTQATFFLSFAEKRAAPTVSFSGPTAYNIYFTNASANVSAIVQTGTGNTKSCNIRATASGLTPGQACFLQANSSPSIFLDAEL